MAVAIILLYCVNNISGNQIQAIDPTLTPYYAGWLINVIDTLASMRVPYLTRDFLACLWTINLFLCFAIIGNFILLLYRPRWFHHLVMLVINALAILAVYGIYRIFPFDIHTTGAQTLAKIIIWVILALVSIALVFRLFPFIKALGERERTQPPGPPTQPSTPFQPSGELPPEVSIGAQPPGAPVSNAPPEQPGEQQPPEAPVSTAPPEQPEGSQPSEQPAAPQPPQTPPTPPAG